MRTAKELIADYRTQSGNKLEIPSSAIENIINEARKEAIEECAAKADGLWEDYVEVNGEHIRELIKDLK